MMLNEFMRDQIKHRIFHLIDTNTDTVFFHSIAAYHNQQRFPVTIGSIAPSGPLHQALGKLKTPTYTLRTTSRQRYGIALKRLVRLLRTQPNAILHAHCFDPTLLGLMAARLARVPFVFTRHHSDHHIRLGKKSVIAIDAFCAKYADHVIAVSEATRNLMIEVEKVPPSQITVVYNGREPMPEPNPEKMQFLREELGLTPGPVYLMIARLHEEKGHHFLFEAVPEIKTQIKEFTILLAGDGPHREQLMAEVQQRGLADAVKFLGRRDDIAELIGLATIVVQPSLAESFGIAALEAMSLGKPVVASTAGGLPEVIADGETGILIPPANASALAQALITLYHDPALSRRLGQAGRKRAERFNFARMMQGYEAIYEQVLLQRTHQPGQAARLSAN